MKKTSKKTKIKDLLIQKINSLYDVEETLVKALPKMARAANDKNLKAGFTAHLVATKGHIKRLEQISIIFGVKLKALKSHAIRGLVKDSEWIIKNVKSANAMDSNLARSAQYVEHYEMAGYMAAYDWAKLLGEAEVAELLALTLEEEHVADEKLHEVGMVLDQKIM